MHNIPIESFLESGDEEKFPYYFHKREKKELTRIKIGFRLVERVPQRRGDYMASIKDVAKKANVGIATVSRALNESGYVSDEAKRKIDKAIKELKYTPNELARGLSRNKSGIIGIIVPDLEHPFFGEFCKTMECNLYEQGYKTMICNAIGISNREKDYLDMLNRNIVDGIITGSHSLDDKVYLNVDKPIVALDRKFDSKIPVIHSNHKQGGRLAAQLLIHAGCQNVIQFIGNTQVKTPALERHYEFQKVCEEHEIKVTTIETDWNKFDYDHYARTAQQYLGGSEEYDGVFSDDVAAVCCMNVLKMKGRKIPEEVSVIGYDGSRICAYSYPQLTSIRQNVDTLAKLCISTIEKMIDGEKDYGRQQIVDVTVRRGNTVRNIDTFMLE